ncbi:MAG: pimeloyl-ACP methyl ester carboxylesterase [Candidatus Latescibacterota bacterium]
MRYKPPNNEYIKDVSCPVIVFHGTEDKIVAYKSGLKLGDLVPKERLEFVTLEGGTHNNLREFKEYHLALSKIKE